MRRIRIDLTVIALLLSATRLAAQRSSTQLLVAGGTATDLRGVRSGALALAPSITLHSTPNFALRLSARGTRFTNSEWSLGGASAAALQIPLGAGFGLQFTASGEATRTSYRASYLSAEGLPALEWHAGAISFWGGLRAAAARTTVESAFGGALLLPPTTRTLSRSLQGAAFGGGLKLAAFERRGSIGVSYREEHARASGVPFTERTAGLGIARGALAMDGSIGLRNAADENRGFGGVRLTIGLAPGFALIGAAESYPSNRLTGAVGGRAFTVGVALAVPGPRTRAAPEPAGVPRVNPLLTRLAIEAPMAQRVEVAGDWNDWHPIPLHSSANGVWYLDVAIPPGGYRYAFRIDGKSWEVPKGVAAVNDGFGGKSGWLTVRGSSGTATQSANRKETP